MELELTIRNNSPLDQELQFEPECETYQLPSGTELKILAHNPVIVPKVEIWTDTDGHQLILEDSKTTFRVFREGVDVTDETYGTDKTHR